MRQQGLPLLPKRRCSLRALASVACVMAGVKTAVHFLMKVASRVFIGKEDSARTVVFLVRARPRF
jgi:hypothetical protein